MKSLILLLSLAALLFMGCKNNSTIVDPPDISAKGQLLLNFDKVNKPSNVHTITAFLSRQGYTTRTLTMNLLSDSSATGTFTEVPVGMWHLKIDAKDNTGQVVYTGETDVNIIANIQLQVSLVLNPVPGATGSISIFVRWGTNSGNWMDYASNPVLTKINNVYELYGVLQPNVIYADSTYKMWYTGLNNNGLGYILYAQSSDGINWTRPISNPVLSPGTANDAWDKESVNKCAVIADNGIYRMYYTGWSNQWGNWHIGLATSVDGITWEKHNTPVLSGTSGWEYQIGTSAVIKRNGLYYLYYTGRENNGSSYSYKLGLATSSDGINFTKCTTNPIMLPTNSWEANGVACSSILAEGGILKMAYHNATGTAFGKAYSTDGINWEKSSVPFFKKENTVNNWGASEISHPCLIKVNNQYRVYYSGYSNVLNLKIGFTSNTVF